MRKMDKEVEAIDRALGDDDNGFRLAVRAHIAKHRHEQATRTPAATADREGVVRDMIESGTNPDTAGQYSWPNWKVADALRASDRDAVIGAQRDKWEAERRDYASYNGPTMQAEKDLAFKVKIADELLALKGSKT
jgi:hypothetical protein